MSKWDGIFNGTYDTSKYARQSLEDDILDAGRDMFAFKGASGELIRYTGGKIDVWGEGDGNGNYPHYYYNGKDDHGKAPDDRHK